MFVFFKQTHIGLFTKHPFWHTPNFNGFSGVTRFVKETKLIATIADFYTDMQTILDKYSFRIL